MMKKWGTPMEMAKYKDLKRYVKQSPQERLNNMAMFEYMETVFDLIDTQKFVYDDLMKDYLKLNGDSPEGEEFELVKTMLKNNNETKEIEQVAVPIDPIEIMMAKTRIAKQLVDTAKLIQNATAIESEKGNAKPLEQSSETGTEKPILN